MKYKAMKFWIGQNGDKKLSDALTGILRELGYNLTFDGGGHAQIMVTKLHGGVDSWTTTPNARSHFINNLDDYEEINIDWMRSIKPETITIEGLSKTYIKSELEEALRHIKPVGEE